MQQQISKSKIIIFCSDCSRWPFPLIQDCLLQVGHEGLQGTGCGEKSSCLSILKFVCLFFFFFESLTLIASPSAQVPAVSICYGTAEITLFVSFHQIKIYMCRRKIFGGLMSKEKKSFTFAAELLSSFLLSLNEENYHKNL